MPIPIIILLCVVFAALLILVLILTSRASLTLKFVAGEIVLYARLLFFKIQIYPEKDYWYPKSMSKKKAERIKKKLADEEDRKREKREEKEKEKEKKRAINKKIGRVKKPEQLLDILDLIADIVKQLRKRFLHHLHIKLARIKIKIGTGDAAVTALTYGAVTQSVNVLLPLLDDLKNVKLPKNKNIEVTPDFTAEESELDIHLKFSVNIVRLVIFLASLFFELVKYFFKVEERKDKLRNASRSHSNTNKNKTKSSPRKKGI